MYLVLALNFPVRISSQALLCIEYHSSEIKGLCLMNCSSETLQNLTYIWNMKTHVVVFVFQFVLLFPPNECPGTVYVNRFSFHVLYLFPNVEE